MDYKEMYEKAIKRAKAMIQVAANQEEIYNSVITIFPELRESEDEKIRKELIEQVVYIVPNDDEVDSEGNVLPIYQKRIDKYLAWLEKQKEFVSADFDDVWETADCNELTDPLDKYSKDAIKKMCHAWYDKGIELERRNWLEKQGEQKPVEKEFTFKAIPRLLDMIPSSEKAKSYCGKLSDTLDKEGYHADAKIVRESIKVMNGEKVAMATMDEEKPTIVGIMKNYFATTPKEQQDKDWEELKHLNDIGPDIEIAFGAKDSELVEASYYIPKGFHAEIDGDKVHIKKCEQKPADKVEPKFKVGDWIVQENIGVYKVTEICESWYEVIDGEDNHYSISFDKENGCHLWTIQDAKDGDVLAGADNIIIYGGYINNYGDRIGNKAILAYCGWNGEQLVINKKKKEGFGGIGYVPATKEQRDLLFKKMHEAGYEWDAEKKELKKIEQKPTNLAKGEDYGIDGLYNAIRILEKTLGKVEGYQTDDGILEHECAISAVKKLYEQKPAWSEEDEKMLNSIIEDFGDGKTSNMLQEYFLKTLKDRVQPQTTWKPSDEQIGALEHFVRSIAESGFASPYDSNTKLVYSLLNDLKKLKL